MKFSLAKAVAGGASKPEKRPAAEQLQETSKRAKVLKAGYV